jgi:hypothetical protein
VRPIVPPKREAPFAAGLRPHAIFVVESATETEGTSLALNPRMPTATTTSTQQKESHDAARVSRPAPDEVVARSPMTSQPEPAEAREAADSYDLPCTD